MTDACVTDIIARVHYISLNFTSSSSSQFSRITAILS